MIQFTNYWQWRKWQIYVVKNTLHGPLIMIIIMLNIPLRIKLQFGNNWLESLIIILQILVLEKILLISVVGWLWLKEIRGYVSLKVVKNLFGKGRYLKNLFLTYPNFIIKIWKKQVLQSELMLIQFILKLDCLVVKDLLILLILL